MSLIFSSEDITTLSRGLTFDDVLIVPSYSEMDSRSIPKLQSRFTKNHNLDIPFIAANMDTITESQMHKAMSDIGASGIIHRFLSEDDQAKEVKIVSDYHKSLNISLPVCAAVGVKKDAVTRAEKLVKAGANILTVDIAHGDSIMMYDTLTELKKSFPEIDVIAGNTATAQGVKRLINAGADAVKVGIGPGSMCTTRIVTGCGVPQLTAIALAYEEASKYDIPVIADGGIRASGDVVKALAAGASSVMVGSLLSGTDETPGEFVDGKKRYRGMASKDAQENFSGKTMSKDVAPEGEATWVDSRGPVKNIILNLAGGIRSGMTYINAKNLSDIRKEANFMQVTNSGIVESRPHGTL